MEAGAELPGGLEHAVRPLGEEERAQHGPDHHWIALSGRRLRARCSAWWSDTPTLPGKTCGIIGHYAAADAEAGTAVLSAACTSLRARGCSLAIGPMDGNTWRTYRLVVEPGTEPPFLLEPHHPREWVDHFGQAGFQVLATYTSAVTEDLGWRHPGLPEREASVADAGIRIRTLDASRLDGELRRIHELSLEGFRDNFLYTPIGQEEFVGMYARLQAVLVPSLVLLAERGDRLEGYAFGVPDVLRRQRGEPADTAIFKTMTVRPGRRHLGLGTVLWHRLEQQAGSLGFRRVIHALMHEDNRSRRMSDSHARTIRRYAIFARDL